MKYSECETTEFVCIIKDYFNNRCPGGLDDCIIHKWFKLGIELQFRAHQHASERIKILKSRYNAKI